MFGNTSDRIIHFANGGVVNVRLSNNEIRIHQDFDLSKDTKFSTRTLLLLCVFCIGVFGFGLSPNFFGYNLSTNYRYFGAFCLCVLCGQSFITWFQYSLNKEKLRQYLYKQKAEISRLEQAQQEVQQKIDGFHNKRNEILKKTFPQTVDGQQVANSAEVDNVMKPLFDRYSKHLVEATQELNNAKIFYRDSKVVYKWINGYVTSGLVLVAIVLGVLSLYYNKSVADALFSHVSDLQYVSININNIDPYCLLHN